MDYLAFDYHSDTYSHIDALCHVAFEGWLYNGHPAAGITWRGAAVHGIEALKDALVGRGVLLDIPRLRGASCSSWRARAPRGARGRQRAAQGVTVGDGDILLVRTGHPRRLAELGPWDTAAARAGLHPTAMPFVAERRVAALGSDGNSDAAPSMTEGVAFPIHVLAINAMGVRLLDYLQLEDLRRACEAAGVGSSCSWPRRCGSSAGRPPQPDRGPVVPSDLLSPEATCEVGFVDTSGR